MTAASTEKEVEKAAEKDPESGKSDKAETPAQTLERLRVAHRKSGAPSHAKRIEWLDKLEEVLLAKKEDIAKAISADFGNRSKHESLVAEVFVTVAQVRYVKERLHEWMEPE